MLSFGRAPIVAEHAFGLMFAAAKRTAYQTAQLKAGLSLRPRELQLMKLGSLLVNIARSAVVDDSKRHLSIKPPREGCVRCDCCKCKSSCSEL